LLLHLVAVFVDDHTVVQPLKIFFDVVQPCVEVEAVLILESVRVLLGSVDVAICCLILEVEALLSLLDFVEVALPGLD